MTFRRPTGAESNFQRYARIYEAFLTGGVPLVALIGGTKKIAHITAPMSRLWDPYQVEAAMDAGIDIGAITHQREMPGINPLGFWDLDIDGADHGLDLSPFTFRVRRTGEPDRAHYWARLPDPQVRMETSYKGAVHDLCTWNTVMPGSYHESGTIYEFEYLDNAEWVPWDGEMFTLCMLPVVDPEAYRIIGASKTRMLVPGRSGDPDCPTGAPSWVVATGRIHTRIKKAVNYLCAHARPSVSGMRGHVSLLVAISNLRLYYRLPMDLVINLVKEYFNPRCIDMQGNPFGWTEAEIRHKWNEAGKAGAYPTLGVSDPKAKRKVATAALGIEVAGFLNKWTAPGGSVSPKELLNAFIASRGGEAVSATAFGHAVRGAIGLKAKKSNGRWVYRDRHLAGTCLGLTNSEVGGLRAA